MLLTESLPENQEAKTIDLFAGHETTQNDLLKDQNIIQNDPVKGQILKPPIHKNKLMDITQYTITGEELWDMKVDKIPHLVENLIPASGLTLEGGTGGIGKSTYARQLSCAIARGDTHFLGMKLNASSHNVIYVATEDGKNATSKLLRDLNPDSSYGLKNITYITEFDHILDRLDMCCYKLRPALVVLDCLADLIGGEVDFNSSGNIRAFLTKLNELCDKYNTAILFIHHVTKNAEKSSPKKNNILGSVSWTDKVRVVLEFRKDEFTGLIDVSIVKSNYLPPDITNQILTYQLSNMTFYETGIQKSKSFKLEKKVENAEIEAKVLKLKSEQPTLTIRQITQLMNELSYVIGKTRVAEIIKQSDLSIQDSEEISDGHTN